MKVLIFLTIIIFWLILTFIVMPKYLLKSNYSKLVTNSNLVKVVKDKFNTTILFDNDDKSYIEQYALIENNNGIEVACKFNETVKNINYDIIILDKNNRVKKVYNVDDSIDLDKTKKVIINKHANTIGLVVKKVNGVSVVKNDFKYYNHKSVLLYTAISTLCFFVFTFLIDKLMIYFIGDLFYSDLLNKHIDLIIALIGSAIYAGLNYLILNYRDFE